MSKRIFTLWWIMNHFCAADIADLLEKAAFSTSSLESIKKEKGGGHIPEKETQERFAALRGDAIRYCVSVNFAEAIEKIYRIADPTKPEWGYMDVSTMIVNLDRLREAFFDEMGKRCFLSVAPDRVGFLEAPPDLFPFQITFQEHMFWGKRGQKMFPEAADDIEAAGNCLAAECTTAAVFHAMRVAEHGLRLIARANKVTLQRKGKAFPIEYGTWDDLIKGIRQKINKVKEEPRGEKRRKRLARYSDLADKCSYMKDLWRNDIMHSRISFNRTEAFGILQRVKDFMLATEKGKTQ